VTFPTHAPRAVHSTTPPGVEKFAEFVHRIGGIKVKPASRRDLFFADVHAQPGS
jgi:NitT/TauT family transport system substrate-binding protein